MTFRVVQSFEIRGRRLAVVVEEAGWPIRTNLLFRITRPAGETLTATGSVELVL